MNPAIDTAFARDIAKGRWDVDFWCERFLGFRPHPGQSRLFRAYLLRDDTRWMARYLTICAAAGNRAGKTLGLAVIVLHSTFYKMGRKVPDPTVNNELVRWLALPYEWYHFGIHTEVAELLYHEIVRLTTGLHEAQTAGCPMLDMFGSGFIDTTKKFRGEYHMVRWHDAFGGGTVHFRTTGEKALGTLGKDMDGESFDECAFEPQFDFIVNEVLHQRRLGTGGQLVLIGTMTEGLTAFSDKWQRGDPEQPDKDLDAYSLRISTRENIGYGINQRMFDRLVAMMPAYLIPQNIDGFAIESRSAFFGAQAVEHAFDAALPELAPVRPGHRYAHGADPALTYDSSWGIVLDATDLDGVITGARADKKTGRQTLLSVAALIADQHYAYSQPGTHCVSGVDVTGFGGKAFRDELPFDVRGVEFGGKRQVKLKLLLDLKNLIDSGRLRLPKSGSWLTVRRQLLGYKLDDRKLETDAVMALAVAVKMIPLTGSSDTAVEFNMFAPGDIYADERAALVKRMLAMGGGMGEQAS